MNFPDDLDNDNDPVKYTQKVLEKIAGEILPYCPESEVKQVKNRLKQALMKVIRRRLTEEKVESFVKDSEHLLNVESEDSDSLNPDPILNGIDKFEKEVSLKLDETCINITDEEVKAHSAYKSLSNCLKQHLQARGIIDSQESQDPPDVATESRSRKNKKNTRRTSKGSTGVNIDSDCIEISKGHFVPFRDPLSKKFFVNPVKNRFCGHVYEKSAVEKLIIGNAPRKQALRCSMIGCSAYITMDALVEDRELSQKILEKVRQEKESETLSQQMEDERDIETLD